MNVKAAKKSDKTYAICLGCLVYAKKKIEKEENKEFSNEEIANLLVKKFIDIHDTATNEFIKIIEDLKIPDNGVLGFGDYFDSG